MISTGICSLVRNVLLFAKPTIKTGWYYCVIPSPNHWPPVTGSAGVSRADIKRKYCNGNGTILSPLLLYPGRQLPVFWKTGGMTITCAACVKHCTRNTCVICRRSPIIFRKIAVSPVHREVLYYG